MTSARGERRVFCAERRGFQGYWVVDAGAGVLASITVFDTREQAEESTAAAAECVRDRLAGMVPTAPQVTAGMTMGAAAGRPSIRRGG